MSMPTGQRLALLVDRLMPAPGSGLDNASRRLQQTAGRLLDNRMGALAVQALRGDDWLGHPAHPIAATIPIGAWVMGATFDALSLRGGRPADEHAADTALQIGNAAAIPAALMGFAQFLNTTGAARRQTAVHAALNNVGLTLNLRSGLARASGSRRAGRRLSLIALAVVGLSGFLGGDLAYRHGVGVRPRATDRTSEPSGERACR